MREGAVARGRQPLLKTDRNLRPVRGKVNSILDTGSVWSSTRILRVISRAGRPCHDLKPVPNLQRFFRFT